MEVPKGRIPSDSANGISSRKTTASNEGGDEAVYILKDL